MKQYLDLLKDIKENGVVKDDRTGTGTKSVFGRTLRFNLDDGFPIVTTKYVPFRLIVTELLWFLRGDTNIKYLVDNNCYIWVGDAYKHYINNFDLLSYEDKQNYGIWRNKYGNDSKPIIEPLTKDEFIDKIKNIDFFAKKWGEMGPIYSKQWRNWGNDIKKVRYYDEKIPYTKYEHNGIDQIKNLIDDIKNNPDSRRLMVSAWNVQDIPHMVLPPCHYGFQCYTELMKPMERYNKFNKYAMENSLDVTGMSTDQAMEHYNFPTRKLSLLYNARSQDAPLGTPFNISSYALLLILISKQVNMLPYELISNLGDCHIYNNQMDGVVEQLKREPFKLPMISIKNRKVKDISEYEIDDIKLINYKSHDTIKFPLSN